MRVECMKCHCRFDISNREVLAMADKLRAKKAGEANGNLRTDPPTVLFWELEQAIAAKDTARAARARAALLRRGFDVQAIS